MIPLPTRHLLFPKSKSQRYLVSLAGGLYSRSRAMYFPQIGSRAATKPSIDVILTHRNRSCCHFC